MIRDDWERCSNKAMQDKWEKSSAEVMRDDWERCSNKAMQD